jgi:hypothetical protein
MIEDPRPAKRVFITVAEQRWELVPTDKLTFPETKEVKRVSDGMSLKELNEGITNVDGDAWLAWIYVSIRRKWPTLTFEELVQTIGDTPVADLIETLEEETPEVAAADPPARPALNGVGEQQNGNGSGEKIPQPSTLATAGPPT